MADHPMVGAKCVASEASTLTSIKTEPEDLSEAAVGSVSGPLKAEPSDQDEVEQLRKRRRNERDRRRSIARKESMEEMRKTLAALELQKQQLMQHIASRNSPSSSRPELVVATSTSGYPSASTPITCDDYVQLAAEIEEFRRQNAAMVQELAKRDLFNNSLRYRLASFVPVDSRDDIHLAVFTHDEGVAYMQRTIERIHEARMLYSQRFLNRPTFLGWSQYAQREGESVAFAVKKTLRNVTPQQLMAKSWELQTDSDEFTKMGPPHVKTRISVLQKVSDDVLIISRRTEDLSRSNASGRTLVLRTVYMLFRAGEDDAVQTLGIETLDIPDVHQFLLENETWWDIFYWTRFSPVNARVDEENVGTITEFGGTNSCMDADLASSRLAELIFLAIRWETHAVAPFLLQK